MGKKWSIEDEKFLIEHYKTMSNEELAKYFKVSKDAIEAKLHKLGLKRRGEYKIELKVESEERKSAIKILDKGIKLYYEGKKEEAMAEFKKIINNFPEEIDIVRKAKEFIE